MNLWFLAGSGLHAHDYGNAFLFDGFVELLGYEHVWDLPVNPTYHLASTSSRDNCNLDSDLFYPLRQTVVPKPDAIVLCSTDRHSQELLHDAFGLMPDVPIVAVDYSDTVANRRPEYEFLAGPLAAYFKRELPLHADWDACPLPLSYPASRVPRALWQRKAETPLVFYHATDHNGGAPGIPRRRIVDRLRKELPGTALDVTLYRGQEKGTRPSPEEYHSRMARAWIGISWNGAVNWDCNRFWENFAFGLAQVAERPRIVLPHSPIDGEHCLYADTPDEVVDKVVWLYRHPEDAERIARAGHAHFLKHHTGAARARAVLETLQG